MGWMRPTVSSVMRGTVIIRGPVVRTEDEALRRSPACRLRWFEPRHPHSPTITGPCR